MEAGRNISYACMAMSSALSLFATLAYKRLPFAKRKLLIPHRFFLLSRNIYAVDN